FRPCARKRGLGTEFPFEKGWIIESLSDSTIYMAMYTIAHLLRRLPVDALTESFFDYVFLGLGDAEALSKEINVDVAILDRIKNEYEYWYPNDLRHTAPPHLSNHLVFFLMHHAAIFPASKWPKAITLNELMIREGRKMSKSKGNVIPLADVSELYGVDIYRLYCAINADFASVVNWREQDTEALRKRFNTLAELFEASVDVEALKEAEFTHTDRWLLSKFYSRLQESVERFDAFRIREAGINMLFNVLNDVRYYEQRESADRRKRIVRNILEDWLIILSPIVPHICEEVWHKLHDTFISVQTLPELKAEFIDDRVEHEEEYLVALIGDINEILKIARIAPGKIYVYTAENWKWEIFCAIKDLSDKDKIREAMKLRKDKSTVDFVKQAMKNLSLKKKALPKKENTLYFELDEVEVLAREREYLAKEFGCEILINEEYDPKGKKRFAIPLKPAIYVVE
ncbi:MAG: class I tRNA ligase family protein, partial [Euryarchaeota archaeon]|nr:class I tRNA ligase family protein [Euryarchaeota archaeon]